MQRRRRGETSQRGDYRVCFPGSWFWAQLTECSSESDVWDEMMGLKLVGDKGPSFFLMARIWSSARKAAKKKTGDGTSWCRSQTETAVTAPSVHQCLDPAEPTRHLSPGSGLTQSADGAVVGLVAQGVRTGVTQAEVATGQNQGVPDVRETHHTLSTVITDFVLSHLAGDTEV